MNKKNSSFLGLLIILATGLLLSCLSILPLNAVEGLMLGSQADTLYYYSTDLRIEGLSARNTKYKISAQYPVFTNMDEFHKHNLEKYTYELMSEILLHHILENDKIDFGNDIVALANAVMQDWLSKDAYNSVYRMEDSICVEIVLNSEITTFKVSHWGDWSGAHGYYTEDYYMLDKNLHPIEHTSIINPNKLSQFNTLLMNEFDHKKYDHRVYDERWLLNPDMYALTREGLVVIYYGSSTVEGNPQTLIPIEKIKDVLTLPSDGG